MIVVELVVVFLGTRIFIVVVGTSDAFGLITRAYSII